MSRSALAVLVFALGTLPFAAAAQAPADPAAEPATPVPAEPAVPDAAAPATSGEDAQVQVSESPAPPGLVSAEAHWTENGQVALEVVFEGSACQQPGEAQVDAADSELDHVTIPTTSTAEVCTMQLVQVTYEGSIAVEPRTRTLEITVLDPEGRPQAAGSVVLDGPTPAEDRRDPAEAGAGGPGLSVEGMAPAPATPISQ